MHLDGTLQLSLGQASYAGLRERNDDSVGMCIPDGQQLTTKGAVAMIADGISDGDSAKEASDTCVTSFLSDYYSTPESWTVQKSALQVLQALNRWLWGQGQAYLHAERGYLCSLSIVIFKSRKAHVFHVGDSRIYRLRNGNLELLTRDHAAHNEQHDFLISRAMGMESHIEIEYRALEIAEGDIFLLSTGGLHHHINRPAITERLMTLDADVEQACSDLIASALEGQSEDNLSCQIVRVDALPDASLEQVNTRLNELPFPPELKAGDEIDGFTVESIIEASHRSRLYVVSDGGDRYVMKAPLGRYSEDPAYIERFLMESWIGARVNSPHVLRSATISRRKSALYHITEYIDGSNLRHWMENNPDADMATRIDLLEQISKGLMALHRNDIVHRELRPTNIMVSRSGRVKIIDLGGCLVGSVDEIHSPLERDLRLGDADFSAPELKQGRMASPRADQFSLAVIAFELLAGALPFGGKLSGATVNSEHARLRYTPAPELNAQVPAWRDAAIRKALSLDPKSRYGDIYEFLHDLKYPNPDFIAPRYVPLIERYPLGFWRTVAGASLAANAALGWYLLNLR